MGTSQSERSVNRIALPLSAPHAAQVPLGVLRSHAAHVASAASSRQLCARRAGHVHSSTDPLPTPGPRQGQEKGRDSLHSDRNWRWPNPPSARRVHDHGSDRLPSHRRRTIANRRAQMLAVVLGSCTNHRLGGRGRHSYEVPYDLPEPLRGIAVASNPACDRDLDPGCPADPAPCNPEPSDQITHADAVERHFAGFIGSAILNNT